MNSYMNLGPTVPYLIRNANTFCAGDFDGDGRVEIASYCPGNNSLNILSYFQYTDISSQWSAPPQMINAWNCVATIPAVTGGANGWTLRGDDRYFSARLTGAAPLLVIFSPSTPSLGLVQWNGSAMQLIWYSAGQSAPYCGLNSADNFYVADVDGDGEDELVQYSPNDQYLFVLKFDGQSFTYISSSHQTVGPWTMSSDDTYIPAHLVPGAADQLVVFKYLGTSACVLSYNAGSLTGVMSPIDPGMMINLPPITAVDVDGDGLDEIAVYSGFTIGSYNPAVLKWDGKALNLLSQPNTVTANHTVIAMHRTGAAALLMGYTVWPGTAISIDGVQNNVLSTLWDQSGSIPGNVGLASNDIFLAADVDGDGNDELVMFSPGDGWLFTIKWNGSQLQAFTSTQGFAPGWGVDLLVAAPVTSFVPPPFSPGQQVIYQAMSEQQLYPVISAGIAGCSAPAPPSAGDIRSCYYCLGANDFIDLQAALNKYAATLGQPGSDTQVVLNALGDDFIYGYISDSLDPDCHSDIRFEYTSLNYSNRGSFSSMADQLTNPKNSEYIQQLPGSGAAAWSALQTQIGKELTAVGSIIDWGGSDSMGYLNSQIEQTQTEQLLNAADNVNGTDSPSDSSTVTFWLSNLVDAAIWGVAAIPGLAEALPAAPIVLSLVGTLYPAAATAFSPDTPPVPQQVPYGQFQAQVIQAYKDASDELAAKVVRISSDPVLLPILGGLLNADTSPLWKFTSVDLLDLANNCAGPARLQYYSTFIPMRFHFLIWQNVTLTNPYCCFPNLNEGYDQISLHSPDYAYFTEQNSGGTYNIYLLCAGTVGRDDTPSLSYPIQDLFTDLFQNLGVSQADFFHGNGLWAAIGRQGAGTPC